ncbi:MAG: energy transducer TonB [Bacteroidales bacterium]
MQENKRYRYHGIIGTLAFHAVIVLLLILLGFTTTLPLPGEEGVEVSLGSSDEGFGEIQPEKPASVESSAPQPKTVQVKEEIVTQNTEEAPFIESVKEPKEKKEKLVEKVVEQPVIEEPKVNPAALYKGKSNSTTEPGSEGITGKEGDQGKPTGTVDSKNYLGKGGFGEGLSYSLAGRDPKYLPKPSTDFSENGTVVVQITVNKYGKVVNAVATDKGSNTTNSKLRKLAEEAAKKAVFNAKTNAAELQRGTITYHFVVKN